MKERHRFPRRMRLRGVRVFAAVLDDGLGTRVGPLVVIARPNETRGLRLGLAVSRRVGSAVVRNRIKRRLREAFRGQQHDLPPHYDVVVRVRPHEPMTVAAYRRALAEAMGRLERRWARSRGRASGP